MRAHLGILLRSRRRSRFRQGVQASPRTLIVVSRASIERRLLDISDRIKQAQAELTVTDEQLAFLDEEAEDARLRAIVAETPMEVATATEAARHADALRRHRDALVRTIDDLRGDQDALLDRLTPDPAPRS
jgi:hypothetical protein